MLFRSASCLAPANLLTSVNSLNIKFSVLKEQMAFGGG